MNNFLFFTSLIILTIAFLYRFKITDFLYDKFSLNIESEVIVYILSILFVAVILMGMLLDGTKEKYSNISASYNKMRPNTSAVKSVEKPHRYFDIDFDSIFPWN